MKSRLIVAALLIVLLTVVPALIAGQYGKRWGASDDDQAVASQLLKFPTEFGVWRMVAEGEPLSDTVKEELGVASYVSRQYENRENGATVTLLLMVGQSGPLLRHPPNICYANRANRQVGETTTVKTTTAKPESEFTAIEYERPDSVTSDRFVVAYGMTTGTNWAVPKYPRIEFGAAPYLYKVQILAPLKQQQSTNSKVETLEKFANDFSSAFMTLREQGALVGSAESSSK